MPGLKPMFRNSLSAEGAKAVTIKAWAPKARMLMPNSGRFVRLCVRLTILNLLKVYMNLYLRFLHFKFFKVLKQIMYLWIKWIMERCYPHLRWYFFRNGSSYWPLFSESVTVNWVGGWAMFNALGAYFKVFEILCRIWLLFNVLKASLLTFSLHGIFLLGGWQWVSKLHSAHVTNLV